MIAFNDGGGKAVLVPLRRGTVDLYAARAVLDRDEDDILRLIEEGKIEWAWSVARDGTRSRCIRILRESLVDFIEGRKRERNLQEVALLLFKHNRPTIRLSEFFRALNCSSHHALALMRLGAFGEAGRKIAKITGQRYSPSVPREGVLRFLERNRMP